MRSVTFFRALRRTRYPHFRGIHRQCLSNRALSIDCGRSMSAAGDVYGVDCAISQSRAAAIRQTSTVLFGTSPRVSFSRDESGHSLKITDKSEQN
jgi:hypothetical protein